MAKTEGIAANNDDTLLALIASLQGLTLALHGKKFSMLTRFQVLTLVHIENLRVTAAQQLLAAPPPTAPPTSAIAAVGTSATVPTIQPVSVTAPPATANGRPPPIATAVASTTVPATAPAILPILPPGISSAQAGSTPPAMPGTLAAVYLTPLALSSHGIHPTVLQALPHIVDAPEAGTWYLVTVGRYTGVYPAWYASQSLSSKGVLTQ